MTDHQRRLGEKETVLKYITICRRHVPTSSQTSPGLLPDLSRFSLENAGKTGRSVGEILDQCAMRSGHGWEKRNTLSLGQGLRWAFFGISRSPPVGLRESRRNLYKSHRPTSPFRAIPDKCCFPDPGYVATGTRPPFKSMEFFIFCDRP